MVVELGKECAEGALGIPTGSPDGIDHRESVFARDDEGRLAGQADVEEEHLDDAKGDGGWQKRAEEAGDEIRTNRFGDGGGGGHFDPLRRGWINHGRIDG